jgi:hypothetical protein
MPLAIDVYGSLITLPESDKTYVETWGTDDSKLQKWRRKELPDFFDNVNKDEDGNALLNSEQSEYAKEEVRRCKEGFYFMNNGILTYITGKNYFYLQWWKLEDDIYPDYRDADRRYFLFLNYWECVLWCLGVVRGKKRREGASSQATANLIYECIFFTNSNCGLVSKTQIDSRDTFTDMAAFGYQQLPVFLKPRQLNREGSVTELVFAAKIDKKNTASKGLRSKINYRAPVLNAYDRGRMSRLLLDEFGKLPMDVPASKFFTIISKTLVKGAKRVGFVEMPSTVNELTKGGGAEYKIIWDNANQFKSGGRKTNNRLVTYFTPAYDNYEGFIDEYGMSVIDEPTEEQYKYLLKRWVVKDPTTGETISEISEDDIRKGGKAYVLSRREGLTGALLEEEIRMNPCTVKEMFEASNTDCAFNSYNINQRKAELEENPIQNIRSIIFYPDVDENNKRVVKFRDIGINDKNFYWRFTWMPPKEKWNKSTSENKVQKPANADDGAIAVDSYSNSQGGRKYGSKACALVGRKSDLLDPNNSGKPFGMLYGRPAEKDMLHTQVMLCAEFLGYPIWYEHTADDYFGFFKDRGKTGYLGIYPLSLIDPVKRENADRHRGTPITPFSLTKQLDNGIAFFEHHCDKIDFIEILDNALVFDAYDRTKYDILVAFLILISVLQERTAAPQKPKEPLIKVYTKDAQILN